MIRLEFSIAWRYLRSRQGSRLLSLISVIAIGGVLVGVCALIVVMGVMTGMQTDMREKILVASPDLRLLPYGDDMRLHDWQPLLERVRGFPGVVSAAPFVSTQGLVRNLSGYMTGTAVIGFDSTPNDGGDVTSIRDHVVLGDFTLKTDGVDIPTAVLGKFLASKLNVLPGDTVVLLGAAGLTMNAATGAIVPRADSAVVGGIFETGMYEYDDGYLFLSLSAAQRFAGLDGDVTGLEVRTTDRWKAPEVADSLDAQLLAPVRAVDWQENNRSFFQALKLEKLGMGVILLLIVVVAAFNIVSTLTMVVVDKTREIGILRAMGLGAASVRRIFLYQGMVIGAVGTGGGLILGLFLSLLLEKYRLISLDPSVYFIDHLPVRLIAGDVLAVVFSSMLVSTLATLYPAAQAARLYPVEAIRHE